MRFIGTILLLFINLHMFTQEKSSLKFEIKDTLIIKERYHQSVKINILFETDFDTLVLYNFNRFVPTSIFIDNHTILNLDKNSSIGLNYIIEDIEKNIIEPIYVQISFKNLKDEIEYADKRLFVNKSNLRIKNKLLKNQKEHHDYDIAKFELIDKVQSVTLYPLIGYYHNLPKGEYYLYFIYSYNGDIAESPTAFGIWDDEKPDDSKIFRGSLVSNKVKLIVK